MTAPKLFLIDGSYLAYRSYFAFARKPLISKKGENTSAPFAFTRTLLKILDEEQPDYLAVVFDTSEPTFRHQTYAQYKATREKMPDEMAEQIPRVRQLLEAFRIPILEVPGYEADDVMATLAERAKKKGMKVYLFTGDKDLLQLVGPDVLIYKPGRSGDDIQILDEQQIREKWGVEPPQVRDVLALAGDTSDNIPGVPQVGIKTATKLVSRFGSLEKVLRHAQEVTPEIIRKNLQKFADQAQLSYDLVKIDKNVPVEVDWEALKRKEPDYGKLLPLLKELEFYSILERFQSENSNSQREKHSYRTVESRDELREFQKALSAQPAFVLDVETTHQDPLRSELVGLSFSWKEGEAYYIPVSQSEIGRPRSASPTLFDSPRPGKQIGLPAREVLDALKPVLENPAHKKCGQNIKYDMLVLARYGVRVRGVDFDTMVASYLLDPSNHQHNLDSLCLEYLNYRKVPTSELIGKGKKQITMREVPLEKISFYACEDADFTLRLWRVLEPKLKEAQLYELFQQVEVPLISVLKQMEWNGVALDVDLLRKLSFQIEEELIGLEKRIYHEAGQEFNINSPQQLAAILFDKLQLPTSRRTKTGYSTDVTVLEELAKIHPIPKLILEYRQLAKLKSTYVDALPRLINPYTGRLHTSYNQTVAATGRLSSSNPNLQNIPIRTELGRQIRRAFVPGKPDHVILDADYSQIELRIMAHLSGDERLLEAFEKNLDIHAATAAEIFDIPIDAVTQNHRRKAKEINFGIMYGMGKYGLASRLDISVEEAETYIENYFQKYPRVRAFIDKTIEEARARGYVTTLMNRRRYLPELQSGNRRMREFAERTAINTPIQGSAADLIKVAMIRIHEEFKHRGFRAMMIMQVHDELVFEVPESELEAVRKVVVRNMEGALKLRVPIRVDVGVGKNWLEAH